MIVFFSGTGNSEYCARYIAKLVGDDVIDSAQFIRNKQIAQLCSEKAWVFVTPTYAWQLPKVFKSFIRQSSLTGSKNAYFVMTCGGSVGGAASGALALCRSPLQGKRSALQRSYADSYARKSDNYVQGSRA